MSLTALEVRDDLLSYVGMEDAAQSSVSIRRRIFNDMNAALQEIYTRGPAFLREKSLTAVLNAPHGVEGKTLTQFSTGMSGGNVISDDMRGCTFRMDGETVDNEIVDATTLQNPFQGATTTSGSGTIFSDCVIFPEEVAAISGPVWLDQQYQLQALSGRMELLNQVTIRRTEIGQPRFYWVETYGGQLRLRVYPMPDRAYVLRYDAQLKAPQLDFAALWPEVEADASAELIINQVLTGFDSSLTGGVSEADTILTAFEKLEHRVLLGGGGAPTSHASTHVTGGSDVIANAVASGNSGLISGADKAKLDGVAANANNYSHPNHSGDVTSVGDGAQTIANGAVTLAKQANLAANSFQGNNTGSSATPIALTTAQAITLLALPDAIEFLIDGGGAAISTGMKGYIEVPFACVISRATLLADVSGSIVVDVFKCTYANFDPTTHPASGDKLTASAPPTISSAKKAQDSTLTGWTTSLSAGDILGFNVNSCATITRATLSLKVTRG